MADHCILHVRHNGGLSSDAEHRFKETITKILSDEHVRVLVSGPEITAIEVHQLAPPPRLWWSLLLAVSLGGNIGVLLAVIH
jgi:hypothetical protein